MTPLTPSNYSESLDVELESCLLCFLDGFLECMALRGLLELLARRLRGRLSSSLEESVLLSFLLFLSCSFLLDLPLL